MNVMCPVLSIRLGASGKVATGIDIVRRLAQGADYTNAARAMMMAAGCIQAQKCHTNQCPVGTATQDPRRARDLDVADKTERVFRHQQATVAQAQRSGDHPAGASGPVRSERPGVSVLTLPGDIRGLEVSKHTKPTRFIQAHPATVPDDEVLARAATLINDADTVTMLTGIGALDARTQVLNLAQRLQAPMVLTLRRCPPAI